jgi:uncharacterized protein
MTTCDKPAGVSGSGSTGSAHDASHTSTHLPKFAPELQTRLVVMQATPFCNISCDYCYLAHRDDTRTMPQQVVQATAANLRDSGLLGDTLGVVWHAGEPLVVPPRFYCSAFEVFALCAGDSTRIQHSIQTNATLIDEKWCDLFNKWNVRVGVSLDGPAAIHDKHRRTRKGAPTHARVMHGVEVLQRADIPFHIIAVLTADSLDRADDIYDFFVRCGVREVGFNVDEQEGIHGRSSIAEHELGHRRFMERLLERSRMAPGRLHIRELEIASRLIARGLPDVSIDGRALPLNAQLLPFAILNVAANGDFSTFSPELIDQCHPRHGSFVFGNVLSDPLRSMLDNPRFRRILAELLEGVDRCRESCEFFALCGGGAPANKLAEHGSLAAAATAYCRAVVQRPIEIVLNAVEQNAARGAALPEHV